MVQTTCCSLLIMSYRYSVTITLQLVLPYTYSISSPDTSSVSITSSYNTYTVSHCCQQHRPSPSPPRISIISYATSRSRDVITGLSAGAVAEAAHERHQTAVAAGVAQEGMLQQLEGVCSLTGVAHQHAVDEALQAWRHLQVVETTKFDIIPAYVLCVK